MSSANVEAKHVYLKDLHFEHRLWLNQLKFFKEEVGIFEHRLDELVVKNTNKEMLAKLEQFQNQFIREKEVVDELSHKIRAKENELAKFAEEHPIAIDHVHFKDHKGLRDEMKRFNELFAVLKEDFFKYLAIWM